MFSAGDSGVIRHLRGLPYFTKYEEVLEKLKLNTLEERRNWANRIFMFETYSVRIEVPTDTFKTNHRTYTAIS